MAAFDPVPGDERLTVAMVSDSLDEEGVRDRVLDAGLLPLLPGTRAFGRAATVRFEPDETDHGSDPYRSAIEFIDGLEQGELVVVGTSGSHVSAVWGELFSTAAGARGATGVVTDGALRDVERIAASGFPAFAATRRPIDYRGRLSIGGVSVEPGDLVLADDDGVVVIPRRVESAVLGRARERAARESTVLDELIAGETLAAVWARHRIL
jgi:regulator of RNase E activity RraA